MSIRWMDSNVWNTLRERGLANIPIPFDASIQLKTPISQKAVGRELQCNVVVGQDIIYTENGIESRVIVNQKNSGLFDHSLDHIPGMLIIEAFRQTAILLLTNHFKVDANEVLLIQCDVNFSKFGEFGMETVCSASLIENGYKNNIYHINSFINQLGEVIATCNLQFTVIKKTISC